MALTIVVFSGEDPAGPELALTFDAPRLVIGRGDGCEVRLPDPSVSPRHASIRQRGADHVLADEGSTNGTHLGKRRLPPHTPEVLRHGDLFRVGRVWLAVRIAPGITRGAGPAAAKELALELVARGLAAQGEDAAPRLVVIEGRDAGRELRLEEPGRPYVIGRAKDADLSLDHPDLGRRHASVIRRGDHFLVRDLGSDVTALLDGVPLPQTDTPWRPGQILSVGPIQIACEHPAADALGELERSPDEPMRPGEAVDPPAGAGEPTPEPPSTDAPASIDALGASALGSADPRDVSTPTPPPSRTSTAATRGGWGFTDAAVVLVALGVLALSIAGLFWLLGRG
jgi:pSer/pThr/pTyr-binding forkhead associated (FHA) protein